MPQNKKESLLFAFMACSGMVLGMSSYNLWLHHQLSADKVLLGFFPGFIVAFLIENLIVGNPARKLALSFSITKESKFYAIILVSVFMILGMVTFMSFYGFIIQRQWHLLSFRTYFLTFGRNLLAALPLQLLLVGPVSRKLLSIIQKRQAIIKE